MTSTDFSTWLKQKLGESSTINGIAGAAALVAGFGSLYATQDVKGSIAVAGAVFSGVAIAMKENKPNASSIEQLTSDAITAVATRHVEAMVPQLLADVRAVLAPPAPSGPAPGAPAQG